MSLVKPEDFAKALNISYGTIRSKISRGGLLRNKNKLIDTENSTNYIYLLEVNGGDQTVFDNYHVGNVSRANVSKKSTDASKKSLNVTLDNEKNKNNTKTNQISKKQEKEKVNDSKALVNIEHALETKKSDVKKVETKLTLEEKKQISTQRKINETFAGFELRKKEAEVKLAERNAELKQYELEKKAGNSLPLDMIENVISINYKAVFKSVHSQIKNIAMVMVQQLGGTKEDLNSIMIEMENVLDMTVKDSKKKAKIDIDKLIDEYSEVRSRGERRV